MDAAARRRPAPRLTLRPWRASDAAAVNRAVAESREHLVPFMPWAGAPPMSTDERRAWFRERTEAGERLFGAWRAGADADAGGALVGSGGLHPRIGPGGLELGYWVHVAHVRHGVATAMAGELVVLAFADPAVTHVQIHHDVANVASGRVAARLGFTVVDEIAKAAAAPGECGRTRIWRLQR
jgi:ribosomal-protein-serine acetyltransferase